MPTLEELTIGIVNLEKRVEKLQSHSQQAYALALGAQDRVAGLASKLDTNADTLSKMLTMFEDAQPPEFYERERQDRWHATRDAVLPAVYAEATNHSMGVAEVLHDAAAYADAAHGPLEAKAALCTHENYSCVKERQEVEALVKAARRLNCGFQGHQTFDPCGCASCEVVRALKPFEAVKP